MMNDFAGDLLVNNVKDHFTIDKEWEKGMDDKHTMPVDSFQVSGPADIAVDEKFQDESFKKINPIKRGRGRIGMIKSKFSRTKTITMM